MWLGSVIEGFATCLCQIAGKAIADLEPKHGDVIGSFVGTSLVVAGTVHPVSILSFYASLNTKKEKQFNLESFSAFDYTGGYFNPVLATSLKFGCKGNTFTEHVVVYWVGACLGSVLSVFLYHHTSLKSIVCKIAKLKKSGSEEEEEEEAEDHEKDE